MTWTEDVDVSTSAGLAAALDAVEASPEVWDSPLGHQVAKEIVRLVPMRVGPGRVAELAASTRPRERHRSARQDAGEGVLGSLGVSPAAAGAWMSLVAGSRRGGLESALL